jgi:hypothetical protein
VFKDARLLVGPRAMLDAARHHVQVALSELPAPVAELDRQGRERVTWFAVRSSATRSSARVECSPELGACGRGLVALLEERTVGLSWQQGPLSGSNRPVPRARPDAEKAIVRRAAAQAPARALRRNLDRR